MTSCSATAKPIASKHKADVKKILWACTKKDVAMHGKDFDYKNSFCYRWKTEGSKWYTKKKGIYKDKNGNAVWNVKVYTMSEVHELMVNRGPWIPRG